jgi:hypothetical protein
VTAALPPGHGHKRTRLWDSQYRLIWDSATASTPAYQHINTWVNATIDLDGERWSGQFYRSPNGIERWSMDDFPKLLSWPNPTIRIDGDEVWP